MIAAFEEVAKPGETLAIVGGKGWGSEVGLDVQYRKSSQIRVIGFVPDADLACLYHSCQVFVMPSLYEGFGSPIAEALACNARVICSNQCGAIELADGQVTLVDPLRKREIADSLRQHLDDRQTRPAQTSHKVHSYNDTALDILAQVY
jgi:glycosyltransferase involved in cell wall biosynthesis